jgi:hypothetical protein
MFKQSTPTREHHAVADDSNVAVKVFPNRRKADKFIGDYQEVRRLLKRGADPKLAFPPGADVALLVQLANRTSNLQTVELKQHLPEGSAIKSHNIAPSHWTRRENWSLREL